MPNAATATYAGRSVIWNRLKGNGTEPKYIGWGISTVTGSANSDVGLFTPATEPRAAGTSSLITKTQLADTYQVTGSITCLVAGKTITEAGLFDVSTLAANTTLAATVTSNTITIFTLGAATGPATANFYMQVANEVVLVTAGQGTTILTVVRGQLGSAAGASYVAGTPISCGGDGGAQAAGATSGQTVTTTVIASYGGDCFAHADFAGIALSLNDSINFTFQDTLT